MKNAKSKETTDFSPLVPLLLKAEGIMWFGRSGDSWIFWDESGRCFRGIGKTLEEGWKSANEGPSGASVRSFEKSAFWSRPRRSRNSKVKKRGTKNC